MARSASLSILHRPEDPMLVERMEKLRVLLIGRDATTVSTLHKLLFTYNVGAIERVNDALQALELLKSRPYDLLIVDWRLPPFDGIALVRTIRNEQHDKRLRRDIPIMLLTTRAEVKHVHEARDAGVTELVLKPFAAKTISSRILQIINHPRPFVESENFSGPCRRRRGQPPAGMAERRARPASKPQPEATLPEAPFQSLRGWLAQGNTECVIWAMREMEMLLAAYRRLAVDTHDMSAQLALIDAAVALQAKSSLASYPQGMEITAMLAEYLAAHPFPDARQLQVIGKHVDIVRVVFSARVEQGGAVLAQEVIALLKALVVKVQ